MLWTPTKGRLKTITNNGIIGTLTLGTGVPGNATTLLDGAVTELISAANNNQDSWGIHIFISETGNTATAAEACLDILIGGATDDILIAALICGYTVRAYGGYEYFFPIHIPAGKRIAAVFASVRTSITCRCAVTLYGGSPPPWRVGRKVTTLGTQINNARGQAITPAASGAAALVDQIIASTAEDYFAFLPGFQAATDTTITPDGYVAVGIGVGAATEERIGTWFFGKNSSEQFQGPNPCFPAFQDVGAGSRLSILSSNSGANDAAYDGLIYAVS